MYIEYYVIYLDFIRNWNKKKTHEFAWRGREKNTFTIFSLPGYQQILTIILHFFISFLSSNFFF